jgi:hypothetical protein
MSLRVATRSNARTRRRAVSLRRKKLLPATSKQKAAAIESAKAAAAGPTLATVHAHLDEAATILANRDQSNDWNSIKESVSAIEALGDQRGSPG